MALLFKGLIESTGEQGTGKTSFALECGVQPEEIAFFDDDIKGRATVEDFRERYRDQGRDFGGYYDLVELGRGKTLIEFHHACLDLIEREIKPGKFRVIAWDTWTRFGKTCRHYVNRNQSLFRKSGGFSQGGGWSDMGRIKGAEVNQEGTLYEAAIINGLLAKVDAMFIVAHLKAKYVNNQKTEAEIPAVSDAVTRLAQMRIWTRHNPRGAVPIGLLLKRPSWKVITERGLRTVNPLPRKLTPNVQFDDGEQPNDESLWDTIARYVERPIGNRQPLPEETPDAFELSILDGTLTEDQKVNLRLALRVAAGETINEYKATPIVFSTKTIEPDLLKHIKQLKANDNPPLSEIMQDEKVKASGLKPGEIAKLLRG